MLLVEENNNSDDILIEFSQVVVGMYLVRQNAKQIFQDAKFFYENERFQTAIPLFVNSIEESLKSQEMAIKFRKKKSISTTEWEKLKTHKHKLTNIANFVIENTESMDDETTKSVSKELGYDENIYKYRNEIIAHNKAEKNIEIFFQKLKEFCLYQNWNTEFKKWDEFGRLKKEQKEDLAYYMMKKAESHLHQLDMGIELAVNVIRRDMFMIKDLEFPTYNEFREPKDYETRKYNLELDYFKYHRGLRIVESVMIKKAFAVIDQIMTMDLLKSIKLPSKENIDDWEPHPLIRAFFVANANNPEKKDGKFAGLSGDADLTKSGEPMMTTFVGIKIDSGIMTIENIMINGTEFSVNDKVIEQIMKTEKIIDAHPGKEIPLEKVHQALAQVGLKMRKLKDSEIQPAIDNTRLMLDSDWKIEGITEEIIEQIKSVTKQNWEDADPNLRAMISSFYGHHIIKDEDTIVMSGAYDPIEKFKVRGMIYKMLMSRNDMNIGTA